jgi:hypothetical protein
MISKVDFNYIYVALSFVLLFIGFSKMMYNIGWKLMKERSSQKGKSVSFTSCFVTKRVHCSNQTTEQKTEKRLNSKIINFESLGKDENLCNSMTTKKKIVAVAHQHSQKDSTNLEETTSSKLSVSKNAESESTADCWTVKVGKSKSIQDGQCSKIRNALLAITQPNVEPPSDTNK